MQHYLTSFADSTFKVSQEILNESAKRFGIKNIFSYSPEEIMLSPFYKKNKFILDQKRGAGYWLWKPYIILESFKKMNYGDILFYSDAGIQIISSLNPISKIASENNIVLFSNDEHLNKEYTKRDCFVLMDCDDEKYWVAKQIQASFQAYKKSKKSIEFVGKWFEYCSNEQILTDKQNICGENLPGFIDHRHDQSILSLLSMKENIEIFRDPSQWGNYSKIKKYRSFGEFLQHPYSSKPFSNSPYPQLLNHHRNQIKIKTFAGLFLFLRQSALSYANNVLSIYN